MNDESDAWAASALSVRERLREEIAADSRAAAARADAEADPVDSATAVTTVVAVEGSAYRRPGAKRLVAEEGAVGAITAGCLEGPVADLAETALSEGPVCERFDLTGDDDAWGFGLGCNGVIDVLVEPADASFRPALDALADGERVALLTMVGGEGSDGRDGYPDAPVGARALVADSGAVLETPDSRPALPGDLLEAVGERAGEFAAAGRSDTVTVETDRGTARVFVDGLEPPPELLVFGHGADVRPVSRLARDAGFRVTVATARGARADGERFPAAHEVTATRPSEIADAIPRPAETYAVVMSHNFVDDRLAVEALLETDVPYVGLMGPRKRFEEMREEVAESRSPLSADELERVGTPVGLDLGGGEPYQIALSVVGEVLAVSNDRAGGRLTDSEGPIHPRSGSDSA
ncbi:XdhC family protein [Halorussus salinus]|uniref:XdhC family protein n=1 Tax=Halorussus salinus TaxID=1364935 RepID=UPI0010921752|nr:XdhC/CoxI family protein [Halorussus salinus]